MNHTLSAQMANQISVVTQLRQFANVCKLRIGVTIAFTALAGVAVTPGSGLAVWQMVVIGLAVLVSSAAAGGYNQFYETDLDARMERTRNRPFVTGELAHGRGWLLALYGMVAVSVLAAAAATNVMAALYVFLGAFFYAIVYTVWLKRRTWLNIVIGGLAGSFAVLAGAAAVNPRLGTLPLLLALVLFLWTPSHFWSLAIAMHKDYAAAGVPMLPVVVGDRVAARVVLANTVLLVAASVVPFFCGLGWIYCIGAVTGGAWFLYTNFKMVQDPNPRTAMTSFHASLVQLTLLLTAAIVDVQLLP